MPKVVGPCNCCGDNGCACGIKETDIFTATIVNNADCPNADGETFSLVWNDTNEEWEDEKTLSCGEEWHMFFNCTTLFSMRIEFTAGGGCTPPVPVEQTIQAEDVACNPFLATFKFAPGAFTGCDCCGSAPNFDVEVTK